MTTNSVAPYLLPSWLTWPVRYVPYPVYQWSIPVLLNQALAIPLMNGDFDFLQDATVQLEVRDLNLSFGLTMQAGKLALSQAPAQASVSGDAYDFLLIANRKEDPDALFFQRRLRLGGDTELGLMVKNLLDSLDYEQLPRYTQPLLEKALQFHEKCFIRQAPQY